MGSKSSAPEPTDPKDTASAQTGTNVGTAIANAILQNPNQITPDGTLTYYVGGPQGGGQGMQESPSLPEIQTIYAPENGGGDSGQFSGFQRSFPGVLPASGGGQATYRVGDATFDSMDSAREYRGSLSTGANGSGDDYYTYTDPYTGETYQIPRITAVQTLSDEQQAIADQSNAAELNLATLANNQSAFLNNYMAEPFSYTPGDYETWALNLYDQLNSDTLSQQQESLRSQLANQGIKIGSEAYDRAMESLGTSQQNSQNQFLLDAYNTGMQTALTDRNQPINEISALLSGSQVSQPNFVSSNSSGIPTTDVASIIANADAAEMAAWQQNQASTGSFLSGMGGLFQGLGAAGLTLSDERAKTDKKKIGETEDGLGLYSFKMKGDDRTQIGLMAQQVEKVKPDAVKTMRGGVKAVDYERALKKKGYG